MNPEVRAARASEWDDAWDRDETATFFQSRAWAEAWARGSRGRMRPAGTYVKLGDGSRFIIPFTLDRRLGGWVSMARLCPPDTWGGPLLLDGERSGAVVATTLNLHPHLRWTISPFAPWELGSISPTAGGHTLVVSLEASEAALRAGWSSAHRRATRKAAGEGVVVEVTSLESDWLAYFAAYQDSLDRWGRRTSSTYSRRFFEALASSLDPRIRLWVARRGGRVVAGVLCFDGRRSVHYWHGATYRDAFEARPANLLLDTAILDARARGFATFDLGPSGGHEGVERFKQHFAPQVLPFQVFAREPRWLRSGRELRRTLRKVVR